MKELLIKVSKDVYKKLKSVCILEDLKMNEKISFILRDYVNGVEFSNS
ncbi:MAG: hypothetical protein ACTSRI_02750 [Promethearchaeota archaeon]